MAIIHISEETKANCNNLYNAITGEGNKVGAIKYLRVNSGEVKTVNAGVSSSRPALGLKESKHIVESGWSGTVLAGYNVVLDNGKDALESIGEMIDEMFALSERMAEIHIALKSKGFNYGGS